MAGSASRRIEVTAEVWDRMRTLAALRICISRASSSAFAGSAKSRVVMLYRWIARNASSLIPGSGFRSRPGPSKASPRPDAPIIVNVATCVPRRAAACAPTIDPKEKPTMWTGSERPSSPSMPDAMIVPLMRTRSSTGSVIGGSPESPIPGRSAVNTR